MPRPEGRPDACIFPESFKAGNRASDKYKSLVIVAEELLQVDKSSLERAWVRRQPDLGNRCFATREKTLNRCYRVFPITHPMEGHPRYDWYPGDNPQVQLGYLTADAKADLEETDQETAGLEASRNSVSNPIPSTFPAPPVKPGTKPGAPNA